MARLFRNRRRMLQDTGDSPALLAALNAYPFDSRNDLACCARRTSEASEKGVRLIPKVARTSRAHGKAQPLLSPALLPGPAYPGNDPSPIVSTIALGWYLCDWPRSLAASRKLKRGITNALMGAMGKVMATSDENFCHLTRLLLRKMVYKLRNYILAAASPAEREARAAEDLGIGYSSPSSANVSDEEARN